MSITDIAAFYFKDDGSIPNNPNLPVLFYQGILMEKPLEIEAIFNQNHWLNSWTNGVYPYHHYHSNTHKVLGVVRGYAALQIGGGKGKTFEVRAGDMIVLPAGTGHKRLSSSPDFTVTGAYPDGMSWNLRTGGPEERSQALKEIQLVPVPLKDPVLGADGPLIQLWRPS